MDDWTCTRCGEHAWGLAPDNHICVACTQDLECQGASLPWTGVECAHCGSTRTVMIVCAEDSETWDCHNCLQYFVIDMGSALD
jgi:hypothetical protein